MKANATRERSRAGQAMLELMVGLVAVMALLAGLLQLATLTRTHSDVMVRARTEAGENAISGGLPATSPKFIKDWHKGDDGKRYTRDDTSDTGDRGGFVALIVDKTAEIPEDWNIIEQTYNDAVPLLRAGADPGTTFGLVRGYDSEDVEVLPAVRSLLYNAESIDVESQVWMTWCTGIY